MPTINFTQFPDPVDTIPNNDVLVGYSRVNGIDVETKFTIPSLANTFLVNAGLSTRTHQIRMLAEQYLDDSYSMAAVTNKEEVICWGQNLNLSVGDRYYGKFGGGYPAAPWIDVVKPIIIPFMEGVPRDEHQRVYDLKANGKAIVQFIWNKGSAIVRLNDGTVWYKGLIGSNRCVGFDSSELPAESSITTYTAEYVSSAFYKIPTIVNARHITCLPVTTGLNSVFAAITTDNDLLLWGEGVTTSPLFGAATFKSAQPQNVTSGTTALRNQVRHVLLTGDLTGNHTLSVITTTNQLWCIGYNLLGCQGNKTILNTTSWTQAFYNTVGNTTVLVDNALKFVDANYTRGKYLGYISTIIGSSPNTYNNIYMSGTEIALMLSNTTSVANAALSYFKSVGSSANGDEFAYAFVNPNSTMLARTQGGQVWSSGKNTHGEGGRTAGNTFYLGPTLAKVNYKQPNTSNATSPWGSAGGLSAVSLHFDRSTVGVTTATTGNASAVVSTDLAGKKVIHVAGNRTLASASTSFLVNDPFFRQLNFPENVSTANYSDVMLGTNVGHTGHVFTFIRTEIGRTYGYGYSFKGLLQGNDGWHSTPMVVF
jgi:hypothetical protein